MTGKSVVLSMSVVF